MFTKNLDDITFCLPGDPDTLFRVLHADDACQALTLYSPSGGRIIRRRVTDLQIAPPATKAPTTIDELKGAGWSLPWTGSSYAEFRINGATITANEDRHPQVYGAKMPEAAWVELALFAADLVRRHTVAKTVSEGESGFSPEPYPIEPVKTDGGTVEGVTEKFTSEQDIPF